MTTQDEKDTEWLAYVVQMAPSEMSVIRDDEVEDFLGKTGEMSDMWLFGERASKEYLRLRHLVMDSVRRAVPEKERRNNAALLGAFETIEEEESLI